jgi:hypothetical protein
MFSYIGYIVWVVIIGLSVTALVEIAKLVIMLRDRSHRKNKAARRPMEL